LNRLSTFVLAAAATLLPFAAQPLSAQTAATTTTTAAATTATPAPPADFRPTRFFTHVEGSGPDVIMIPGLGSSRDVWKDEAAHLTAHYRVHLVQIRGFAGYPAPKDATGPMLQTIVTELAQYIEVLKLDKPAIIGHSMGGLIGLMLAAQHPQDVGKLMVVDAYPYYGAIMDPSASPEQIKEQAKGGRQMMLDEPATNFLHDENAVVATLVKTPDKRPQVIFWMANSDRKTLTTAYYEDVTTDTRAEISKIEAPLTVLYAFDASSQSQKDIDKGFHDAYAAAPHATLIRIDNSAHFIMLDQPQKFDDAVQKFLKS
jgi:pimeloyl-ACP methyl ester carboxylesterase